MRFILTALALPFAVACAAKSDPPPTTPNDPPADNASSSDGTVSVDSIKPEMREFFCGKRGIAIACFVIDDAAACNAAFEAAWPGCTKGAAIHSSGHSKEDREAGRKAGGCMSRSFAKKFARNDPERCRQAAEAAEGDAK
jgi:hypothetical protein